MLQFYEVRAYLGFAFSWGYGSSFLQKQKMHPELLKLPTYLEKS